MTDTSITVIIPCYNSAKTIVRALESVRSQTLQPTEILVYDDASSDNTREVLTNYKNKYPQISVYWGQQNKGAGYGRQLLIEKATSKYIAFLDADDTWQPKKLEAQLKLLASTNADLCICHYQVVNAFGKKIGIRRVPKKVTFFSLHFSNWIPTSMVVFRRAIADNIIMSNIRTRQDYAYWLMIFKESRTIKCVGMDQVLGTYYRNSNGLSSSSANNIIANYQMFRIIFGYHKLMSIFLVIINILVRLTRA